MKVKVNEDFKKVRAVREKLDANNGYCPNKTDKNEDTKCMCKEFLDGGLGECRCGLYIKTEM